MRGRLKIRYASDVKTYCQLASTLQIKITHQVFKEIAKNVLDNTIGLVHNQNGTPTYKDNIRISDRFWK